MNEDYAALDALAHKKRFRYTWKFDDAADRYCVWDALERRLFHTNDSYADTQTWVKNHQEYLPNPRDIPIPEVTLF